MKTKFRLQGMIIGFIAASMLMFAVPTLADTIIKSIDVAQDSVVVDINGQQLTSPVFVWDGSTYVQARNVANLLNMDIGWDSNTQTVSLTKKSPDVSGLPTDDINGATQPNDQHSVNDGTVGVPTPDAPPPQNTDDSKPLDPDHPNK